MIMPPRGFFGEMKKLWTMSPRPVAPSAPGAGDPSLAIGMIVRVIRLRFSPTENGMTGCTLSV